VRKVVQRVPELVLDLGGAARVLDVLRRQVTYKGVDVGVDEEHGPSTAGVRRAVRAASLCNSATMGSCALSGSLAGSDASSARRIGCRRAVADDDLRKLSIGPVKGVHAEPPL
jgi:hypothetical protein